MTSDPEISALVPCDLAAEDANGNYTLHGIRWKIVRPSFPATCGQLWVYIAVNNIHGQADLILRLSTVDGQHPASFNHNLFVSPSPLRPRENAIDISKWVLPAAGWYALDLKLGEKILTTRRILVEAGKADMHP